MSWLRPSNSSRQRPLAVGTLEAIVVLDPHHRHALPGGGELVHRGGDGLFAFGHGRERRVPLGLADDGRTTDVTGDPLLADSVGRCGQAARLSQNRRDVLEQLGATVEGAAADHLERDVGIAVVDPLLAGAPA